MTDERNDPRRFPFPPGIPIVALLISWGLQIVAPISVDWPSWSRPVGVLLLVAPVLFATWAVRTFRRHHTVVDPRGDVRSIVDTGPFRFTRNPMYLSLVLMHVGGLLAFHLPWAALLAPMVIVALHFGVILPEERYLAAKFGEPYASYCRRVRRWI